MDEDVSMKLPAKFLAIFTVCFGLSFLTADARAQANASAVDHTLSAADGWPIHITYFPSSKGKEAPVVILIPSAEGIEDSASRTRKVWESMAKVLQKKDFAVVTVDLRKHGESVPDVEESEREKYTKLGTNDYALMATQDLEAVKDFLLKEHQNEKLNIRKLGIAAAGSSCMVASAFTLSDWLKKPWPDAPTLAARTPKGQDVRAIMMLSPRSPVRGINTTAITRGIADPSKGIAVNVYYNSSDRSEEKSAQSVFKFLELKNTTDAARKIVGEAGDKKYTAEGFLLDKAKTTMEQNIADFFDAYVKQREDPWKSRTSPLYQ
jgi:hypothetical protein